MKRSCFRYFLFSAAFLAFLTGCGSASKPTASEATDSTAHPKIEQSATGASAPERVRSRTDTPPKPPMLCSLKGVERTIEVLEVGDGCWTMYHNGIKKRVARSKKSNVHCEAVRDNIRTNLENAGYKCRWK